jgi:inner membrane protein involved in colicin E2 resistance
MASATVLVLAVTITAPIAGPVFSGILAPMPVIAWPLVFFIHSRQGRTQAIGVVQGTVQGSLGVLVFYLLVGALLGAVNPTLAYFIAVFGAVGVTAPWLWWNMISWRETNGLALSHQLRALMFQNP